MDNAAPKKKSFYEAIKHLEHANHYSDLYLIASPEAQRIMREYGKRGEIFRCQVTGKLFYDIPFMYAPYWEEKQTRGGNKK